MATRKKRTTRRNSTVRLPYNHAGAVAPAANPRHRGRLDEHAMDELIIFIDNDRAWNRKKFALFENYAKKSDKGTFTFDKGVGGMLRNLVNPAARDYVRMHGSMGERVDSIFSLATRDAAAEELTRRFRSWYRLEYARANPRAPYRQHFPRTAAGRPQVPHRWEVELFDSNGNKLGSRKWKGKSRDEARAAAQELVGTKLRKKNVASVVLDGPYGV